MRIIEEEKKSLSPELKNKLEAASPSAYVEDAGEKPIKPKRSARPHKKHRLRKYFFGFFLMLAVIAACLIYLVIGVAGPLVKAVEVIPLDFPRDLAIYQPDQAKVKVQLPENKERLAKLTNSLPSWSLEPFLGVLTTDLKTQLAAFLKDPNKLPDKISLGDLESTIGQAANATKTVNLEWSSIDKVRQEIVDYYKNQLIANGYTVNERLGDYEADLSFFKPGITGAMSVADNFMKDNSSIVKMTVNYFEKN